MRVNFFVMFPVARMPDLPASVITAFRAPREGARLRQRAGARLPNITAVDVSAQIDQVQRGLGQVIRAV